MEKTKMLPAADTKPYRCPFYGKSHAALWSCGRLFASYGNECALIRDRFSPCHMEMRVETPDVDLCPVAAPLREASVKMWSFVLQPESPATVSIWPAGKVAKVRFLLRTLRAICRQNSRAKT